MAIPTPKQPIVLNDDGSISVLIYQGRTFRLNATHEGLLDPTGYKARFGITDKYGNALIAEATTDDGSIVFSPAVLPAIGTVVAITIPDEDMTLVGYKAGKLDLVLEEPGGAEIPMLVGDWTIWKEVTP